MKKVGRQVRTTLKRDKEWMTHAAQNIEVEDIRRGNTWIRLNETIQECFTQVIATLGREGREWTGAATNAKIRSLIEENIYINGSVVDGENSG